MQNEDLFDELILPGRPGRGRKTALAVEAVRELATEDIMELMNEPLPPANTPAGLTHIRHSHHRLAQLLVEGKANAEISAITGYSPSYISNLQRDPTFAELVDFYHQKAGEVFVDTLERLKLVGLTALDVLQTRFEENAEKISTREIMETVEMALIKPTRASTTAAPGSTVSPQINIAFVAPQSKLTSQVDDAKMVIDITPST